MHRIFKLCGSPSEDYWLKLRLPHSTVFKPPHHYRRCVADTFKEYSSTALKLIETLLSVDPSNRGTAAAALKSEVYKDCFPISYTYNFAMKLFMLFPAIITSNTPESHVILHSELFPIFYSSLHQNLCLVIHQVYQNILLARRLMLKCGMKQLEGT